LLFKNDVSALKKAPLDDQQCFSVSLAGFEPMMFTSPSFIGSLIQNDYLRYGTFSPVSNCWTRIPAVSKVYRKTAMILLSFIV
jgi:hypothetical protein